MKNRKSFLPVVTIAAVLVAATVVCIVLATNQGFFLKLPKELPEKGDVIPVEGKSPATLIVETASYQKITGSLIVELPAGTPKESVVIIRAFDGASFDFCPFQISYLSPAPPGWVETLTWQSCGEYFGIPVQIDLEKGEIYVSVPE